MFSQSFEEFFMGNNYEFYNGTELKVFDGNNFHSLFYKKLKHVKLHGTPVLYPTEEYDFKTDKAKLIDRIFKVERIIGSDGNKYSGNFRDPNNLPIFELKDVGSSEIIYFLYDSKYCGSSRGFPFLTKKDMRYYDFCAGVNITSDDFDNTVTHSYRLKSGSGYYQFVRKVIRDGAGVVYLSLEIGGFSPSVMKKGVILLLDDKTKINLPNEEIDCKVNTHDRGLGHDYIYSASIKLSNEHLEILKNKEIEKIRLFAYDDDFNKSTSLWIKEYLNCLN
jgi:hypothetical protein